MSLPLQILPPEDFGPEAGPGAYRDVPDEEYHSHPALSRSVVATHIRECPRKAQHKLQEQYEADDSPSLGTMVHDRVLRPAVFEASYAQKPGTCAGTTASGDPCSNAPSFRQDGEWFCHHHGASAEADDVFAPSSSKWETAEGIYEAVAAHPEARRHLLEAEETELTLLWEDPDFGLRCRARFDAIGTAGEAMVAGDLKTCGSAHPDDVGRALSKTESWLQPAFYERGLLTLTRGVGLDDFVFVFAETEAPHCLTCARLDPLQTERAREALAGALREIAGLPFDGTPWPGYQSGIATVQLPTWAVQRLGLPPAEVGETEVAPV